MTNLDSILKSRDIALPTKVCLVKAMVFPLVMYGCESWTVKKAERRRIDAFVFFVCLFCFWFFVFFTWISIFLFLINIFLNYQSMNTHLQETWKIQNKVPLYITTFFK